MKPVIAIPEPHSRRPEYNERVWPQYAAAVEAAGGRALRVPLNKAPHELMAWAMQCHGVLLPGSPADVDPQKYGAAKQKETAAADAERDGIDELLLQDAYNMGKPVLGICYGVQILNVWRSGTLVQHLGEQPVKHDDKKARHGVEIEAGSRLAEIAGETRPTVNTSHHQALDVVGDGLRQAARSTADGVIEAVEGTDPAQWVLGVQWHPERDFASEEVSRRIFAAFVEAAEKWASSPRAANEPERISR